MPKPSLPEARGLVPLPPMPLPSPRRPTEGWTKGLAISLADTLEARLGGQLGRMESMLADMHSGKPSRLLVAPREPRLKAAESGFPEMDDFIESWSQLFSLKRSLITPDLGAPTSTDVVKSWAPEAASKPALLQEKQLMAPMVPKLHLTSVASGPAEEERQVVAPVVPKLRLTSISSGSAAKKVPRTVWVEGALDEVDVVASACFNSSEHSQSNEMETEELPAGLPAESPTKLNKPAKVSKCTMSVNVMERAPEMEATSVYNDSDHGGSMQLGRLSSVGSARNDASCLERFGAKALEVFSAEEPVRTGFLADIVRSANFDRLSFLVIIANTIYTTYTANSFASTLDSDRKQWMVVVDQVFLSCFTVELIMKVMVHGRFLLINQDYAWNIFDTMIMAISLFETIVELVGASGVSVSFMRVYRIFRVSRILRVFRAVKFLTELRMLVRCLLGSLVSLFWSSLLLFIILLIAALIFVQMVTQFRVDNPDVFFDDTQLNDLVDIHFSSVEVNMMSLFMATTGGMEWGTLYRILMRTGLMGGTIFVLYIIFFIFAFVNIVASTFVDRAMQLAVPDHDVLMLEKRREDQKTAKVLAKLIRRLDQDGGGLITYEELIMLEHDPDISDCLEMAGLCIRDVDSFFKTLCRASGSNIIEIDAFVETCMQMKGFASSLDMQTVLYQIQEITSTLQKMSDKMKIPDRVSHFEQIRASARPDLHRESNSESMSVTLG